MIIWFLLLFFTKFLELYEVSYVLNIKFPQ